MTKLKLTVETFWNEFELETNLETYQKVITTEKNCNWFQ